MTGCSHRIANIYAHMDSPTPWDAASKLADKMLRLSDARSPEINIADLCSVFKVRLELTHLEGCIARLTALGSYYVAEVEASDRRTRQRFSVCHELGHTFFGNDSDARSSGTPSDRERFEYDLEERLCNFIAAELLMPRALFEPLVQDCFPCFDSLTMLARSFGVSIEAAARRIIALELWPMASLAFSAGRDSRPLYRWYKSSRSYQHIPIFPIMRAILAEENASGMFSDSPCTGRGNSVEYHTAKGRGEDQKRAYLFSGVRHRA